MASSELQRKLEEARARSAAKEQEAAVDGHGANAPAAAKLETSSELQRKLEDARARSAAKDAGYGGSAVPVAKAPAAVPEDAGAPWHSKAYILSVLNKGSAFLTGRLMSEAFKAYDEDEDCLLNEDEFCAFVQGFYTALALPAPPKRVAADLRLKCLEGSATVSREQLEILWDELVKGANFKLKIAGAEHGFIDPAANDSAASARGAAAVPSECPDLPSGMQVECVGLNRCHAEFEDGARKLRMKNFQADGERLPPRSGLTVVGSYRHAGAPRGSVNCGDFLVGVRDDKGQEYLVDSRGLRNAGLSKEEGEGEARAREETAEIGGYATVRTVLRSFEAAGVFGAGRGTASGAAADGAQGEGWE